MKTSILPGTAPLSLTLAAGGNQLINWGIVFYMPGTFAGAIANAVIEGRDGNDTAAEENAKEASEEAAE